LETRALARLAGHKFIIDEVQSFRIKYPDWKLCITDLLNELGSKYRTKKKPIKNKTTFVKTEIKTRVLDKNNKSIKNIEEFEYAQSESEDARSVSEDVQSESEETRSESKDAQSESEDQSMFEEAQSDSENNTTIGSKETDLKKSVVTLDETQTEISQVQKMLPKENNKNSQVQKHESKFLISDTKDKEECTLDKTVHYSQVKINVSKRQLPEKNLHSSTNETLDNTDVELHKIVSKRKAEKQSVSNKVDYKKKRNTVNESKPVCETVDSFFMTADNKDYMSVYKPPPVTERNVDERTKVEYQKPIKEFFSKGKKVIVGKQNNMGNRRERRQQQVEESVDTALHPSWEAKRKQKSLAKFEGKKITFDDED